MIQKAACDMLWQARNSLQEMEQEGGMKVARNTTHNLRHDWLRLEAESGKVQMSLLAHRNEIHVDVTLDGKTAVDYLTPRQLAAILLNACTDPHEP